MGGFNLHISFWVTIFRWEENFSTIFRQPEINWAAYPTYPPPPRSHWLRSLRRAYVLLRWMETRLKNNKS